MTKPKRRPAKSQPQSRKSHRPSLKDGRLLAEVTKAASILKLLSRSGGVTIDELAKAAGWQPHSVRGFLSGHVRKKLGLTLSSEKNPDAPRRYLIIK